MFKKGESGNPKGKPKGAKNRSSEEVRTLLLEFVDKNLETLQVEFNKLDGEKKLSFFEKLLKHVLPPQIISLSQLSESDLNFLIEKLRSDESKQD